MKASDQINLKFANALVVDDNPQALELLCGVLSAFGLKQLERADSGATAMKAFKKQPFDLIVTDAQMPDVDGYDFVRWLRREGGDAARMTPVIITTAHTRRTEVARARDCGANFIIAKPLSPKVMLERIYWVSKATRPFVICDVYVGPDRRFKQLGPPKEFPDGRRDSDLAGDFCGGGGENLSQEELDAVVAPQRVKM